MSNTIERKEFFGLMRDFMHAPLHNKSEEAYRAVIAHIDKDRAERDRRIVAATVEACAKKCEAAEVKTSGGYYDADNGQKTLDYAADDIRAITPESVLADIDKQEIAA